MDCTPQIVASASHFLLAAAVLECFLFSSSIIMVLYFMRKLIKNTKVSLTCVQTYPRLAYPGNFKFISKQYSSGGPGSLFFLIGQKAYFLISYFS